MLSENRQKPCLTIHSNDCYKNIQYVLQRSFVLIIGTNIAVYSHKYIYNDIV